MTAKRLPPIGERSTGTVGVVRRTFYPRAAKRVNDAKRGLDGRVG